jgi:hypothetical protein
MYYTTLDNIGITSCGDSPLTLVYSQFNDIRLLSCNSSGGPTRFISCATTTVNGLDIEGSTSTSCLDIVHDISTKAGVVVNNFHFEDISGGSPAGDVINLGQKGVAIRDMFAGFQGSNARFIHLLPSGTSYSFDGVTYNTIPVTLGEFTNLANTGGDVKIKLGTGTTKCTIDSTHTIVSNTTNTDNWLHSSGFMSGFKVITAALSKLLWFSTDGTLIHFGDNSNRRLDISGSELTLENTYSRININAGSVLSDINQKANTINLKTYDGTTQMRIQAGVVKMYTLPTSDPASSGQLWNDSGTVKISAG